MLTFLFNSIWNTILWYFFRQVLPTKKTVDAVPEIEEDSPPAHRTRHSSRQAEKLIKTSDYSSEESLDRLKAQNKGHKKEIYQVSKFY